MDKKEKILCVDDEMQIVVSLRALLRSKYEVLTTTSPIEALEILRREKGVRVIISDQRMPKMLGAELLREARQISPGTMRLLLTGYSDLQAIIDSINEGEVFRFINKPWNNQEIRFVVDLAVSTAIETEEAALETEEVALSTDYETEALAFSTGNDRTETRTGDKQVEPVRNIPSRTNEPTLTNTSVAETALLVVDDDLQVSSMVREILGDITSVYSAATLNEAIEILGDKPIGVIIAETVVANEDATEFVKLLKQHYPSLVTIILTRFHGADIMISLINQGQIYRYIYKPIQKNQLLSYVKSALARHGVNMKNPELLKRHQVEEIKEFKNPSLVSKLAGQLKSIRMRLGF